MGRNLCGPRVTERGPAERVMEGGEHPTPPVKFSTGTMDLREEMRKETEHWTLYLHY